MTLIPLLRSFLSLARRPAAPVQEAPQTPAEIEADAAALQCMISKAGLSSIYGLCEQIEQGHEAGKCMYDSGMTSLSETLTSSTGEIKQVIEECARMCGGCAVWTATTRSRSPAWNATTSCRCSSRPRTTWPPGQKSRRAMPDLEMITYSAVAAA